MKKIFKYCFNTSTWKPGRLEWVNLLASIPKEERDRVTSFMFKRDSKQTLMGQILIRYCLKNLLNIDWHSIILDRNTKGRPYLKLKETLALSKLNNLDHTVDFNVSHAGDYTILAAGMFPIHSKKKTEDSEENGPKVGTDVMKIDIDRSKSKLPNECDEVLFRNELQLHERVINSKFSTIEKNYIYNRPNPVERLTAFYRLWCLKESYVKAIGDGMGFDIKRIECLANSELLIDLNSKKYLVASDSQVFVDSKIVKNLKFYEQYFMNTIGDSKASNERPHLHIMTVCIVENEKVKESKSQAEASGVMNEFVEITLSDLLNAFVLSDKVDEKLDAELEDLWLKFDQKDEKPLMI